MAFKTWIGSVSDDINVAGNWSPSGIPVTTDDLSFNEQSVNNALTNVTTSFSAFTINKWAVTPRFTKRLGASGSFFTVTTITDMYFQSSGDQAYISGAITRGTVDAQSTSDTGLVLRGTINDFTILRGKVVLDATGMTVASGAMVRVGSPGRSTPNDTKLTINSGVTVNAASTIIVDGGEVVSSANMGIVILNAGTFTLAEGSSATLVTLNQNGGVFNWNSSGNITTAHVRGGLFDASRANPAASAARTITTLRAYNPTTEVNFNNGGLNHTITNFYNHGAKLTFTNGTKITIA